MKKERLLSNNLTGVDMHERVHEDEHELPDALETRRAHVQDAVIRVVVERVSVCILG